MFLLTFLILNTADTPRQLDNNIFQTSSIAQKYNCALTRLDFQQEEGLMSSLPLGLNQIEIQRGLTTSSVAIFVPFTTQELFQNGSEALYYGINALSNNLIMVDRKLLKNPNGLILGTPGSGKSFSAKREITNAFLICPKDDIIICDPEGEYTPLVERLHGQVIKLSPTGKGYDGSPCYINPMDLNLDYSDDDNPLSLKSDFILSLCELIVGGKDGLAPVEKTIIDRCVRIVYRDYLNDPKPENMPLLEDLYNALRAQDEKEAQYHYRDNRLDTAAVDQVVQQFGYDRAFHILAITVCQADWDRRYSPDNRVWANAMSIPANPDAWGTDRNCYLAVSSHPGLVDLFLSQTRKAYAQERQKTSVRDMLKKLPETTSPKISAKSKSPER